MTATIEDTTEVETAAGIKLDIGCGRNKQKTAEGESFIGVDISPDSDADVIHDLGERPWPFEDNSVDEAFSSHVVEHVPSLQGFMSEVHRILKPDAQIRIVHPHLRSNRAFQDPTHVRFIPEETWYYFARDWREANGLGHYETTHGFECDFGVETMFYSGFHPNWQTRSEEARQFALAHYWNVAGDLVVDLKARK